ncbi:hypothetical protein HELRODRAFT_146963, partial [Helobdella robusta]|uniref:Fork-head domain-containing protein n=1 Tax=Helobdella robusta TaxID=6412 RepID=T1EJV9_HELRO
YYTANGLPPKPTYSYPELIFMAMQEAPQNQITVSGIYAWIQDKFSYFKNRPSKSWQNSIRHCLSLSSAFQKVEGVKDQ